jgi:transposase-like protein
MKANLHQIKKSRIYSEGFKREIVNLFESGKFSVPQIEKLYKISNSSIYQWIYKFSNFNEKGYRVVEHKISSMSKLKELELRIKQLEQTIGQKQIKIDYLEKMIDIAKLELNVDIKKNFNTSQSTGSETIKEK